jgi:anti-sigma-K factor RskA
VTLALLAAAVYLALAIWLGRRLRRQRRLLPLVTVVRDERLDISAAVKREAR